MTDTQDMSTLTDEQLAALIHEGDDQAPEPVAEEAAPEAAPEPVAEAPEPVRRETQHVPLAELLEERGRRKEAQARMEEMEQRFVTLQQQVQQYMATQQPATEEPMPAFEADPIVHLRQQQAKLSQTLEVTQRQLAEREMASRQAAQWQQMREAVGQSEAAYARERVDYYDAVNFLRGQRTAQYQAAGVPEGQIPSLLQRDAVTLAQTAASLGRSPAQFAYETALGLNYRPRQQQEKAGAHAAEAPKSLGGTSGRADDASPSLSDLSKLSDKEFDKVFSKVMGGT